MVVVSSVHSALQSIFIELLSVLPLGFANYNHQYTQVTTVAMRMSVSQANCVYGQLSQFEADQETMSAYLEQVEIFFQANNIAEEKQAGIFLSLIGGKTYGLLWNLVAPAKPKEKALAELTKTPSYPILSPDHSLLQNAFISISTISSRMRV